MDNIKPMFSEDLLKNLQPVCNIDYVEYQCEIHGMVKVERRYYINSGITETMECPFCSSEHEKRIEVENNINLCKKCNIEPEFYDKTLEAYEADSESQKKALSAVKSMQQGEIDKIVLLGDNGTGKTMLGSIMAKYFQGKIYSMYEISTMIRQSYTSKAIKSELEIVNELASVPFLAIDELGRTNGSSSEMNWLSYILDKRHVRRLPVMLLSNLHPMCECDKGGCDRCFEKVTDKDILSRLRQHSKIISVKGRDYRSIKKVVENDNN